MRPPEGGAPGFVQQLRSTYRERMAALQEAFEAEGDGLAFTSARAALVDEVVKSAWHRYAEEHGAQKGVALLAVGGYGRGQLFPFSDIDLLLCTEKPLSPSGELAFRQTTQALWDAGLQVATTTRTLGESEPFRKEDTEGSIALLDTRLVVGDAALYASMQQRLYSKRSNRDRKALLGAIGELTRERHARFSYTLFHLEPNVKDAPGGLRDLHVVAWLEALGWGKEGAGELRGAVEFLTATRVFLHLRHGRDDNTLDWHAQDEAAQSAIGCHPGDEPLGTREPANWMRAYFRHARMVQRTLEHRLAEAGELPKLPRSARRAKAPARSGFVLDDGVLQLKLPRPELDPAQDPEVVFEIFGLVAEQGVRLAAGTEERIAAALPGLSARLEDGPLLWRRLRRVLCGRFASDALRAMHALGLLDLLVPEFHGIEALVIRDAYHRYTVDEHTFVLIDALHGLADKPAVDAPEWRARFHLLLRELPHADLLYLAALLHDTGKARSADHHAEASVALAQTWMERLEMEPFERKQVSQLIGNHLEMSATLRRDIFDVATVRAFAEKIGTHDLLRMLTLFTFADISAVHPDALSPWKAEDLWRLWMAAENQLDRNFDHDRIHTGEGTAAGAVAEIARALRLRGDAWDALEAFLDGVPERYLRTRSPETILAHKERASSGKDVQVILEPQRGHMELTLITSDRPQLFADLTGALTGWGMNIVSAEAFSNAKGVVIDTFRFTDPYRTLELNPEERTRFERSLEAVVLKGENSDAQADARRAPRRARPRRVVPTGLEFDNMSSARSTLLQIIAQDQPGLLHKASLALSRFGCSVEVALIDTEGEMAIDVFYVTLGGAKLDEKAQMALAQILKASL